MKILKINRKFWLHTKKDIKDDAIGMGSMLFRPADKKMCCLGFYLNQCGVSKKNLKFIASPGDIIQLVPKQTRWLIDEMESFFNSRDSQELMTINDGRANEDRIKKIFAKHDVKVKFDGMPEW